MNTLPHIRCIRTYFYCSISGRPLYKSLYKVFRRVFYFGDSKMSLQQSKIVLPLSRANGGSNRKVLQQMNPVASEAPEDIPTPPETNNSQESLR